MKDKLGWKIVQEFVVLGPKSIASSKSVWKIIKQYCNTSKGSEVILLFTEKKKIALCANDSQRILIPDRVILYQYGVSPGILCKEKLKRHSKIKKLNIMINFNDIPGENTQEHNPHWWNIPQQPNRILIARGSGSWIKKNQCTLFNSII